MVNLQKTMLLHLQLATNFISSIIFVKKIFIKEDVSILKISFENRLNVNPSPIGIRIKEAASLVLRQPLCFI